MADIPYPQDYVQAELHEDPTKPAHYVNLRSLDRRLGQIIPGDNITIDHDEEGYIKITAVGGGPDPFRDHLSKLPDVEYSELVWVLPLPDDAEPPPVPPNSDFRWELFSELRADVNLDLPDVLHLATREELPGATAPSDIDPGFRWTMYSEDRADPHISEYEDLRYHFDPESLHGIGVESDADSGIRMELFSGERESITVSNLEDLVHSLDTEVLAGGAVPSDKDAGARFELFAGDRAAVSVGGLRDFSYLLDPGLAGQAKTSPSNADTGWRFELRSDVRGGANTDLVDVLARPTVLDVLPGRTRPSDLDAGIRWLLESETRQERPLGSLDDIMYHHDTEVLKGAAKPSDADSGIFMILSSELRELRVIGGYTDITTAGETWFLPGFTVPSDRDCGASWLLETLLRAESSLDLADVEHSEVSDVFESYYGPSRLDSGLRFAIPAAADRPLEDMGVLEDLIYSN